MEVVINKKKYHLSFGMICWEQFYKRSLAYAGKKNPSRVDSLSDLIESAIADYNEVHGSEQKIERKALKTWVNMSGVTESGVKTINEIEKGLTDMMQYKTFLKEVEDKKKAMTL